MVYLFGPKSLDLPEYPRVKRQELRWPTDNPVLRTIWEKFVLPGVLNKLDAQILFCPGGIIAGSVPHGCKSATMFRNMLPFDPKSISKLPFGLQRLRNFLLKRAILRSLSHADLAIFISEHARKVIEEHIDVPNSVTIPHGISKMFKTHDADMPWPTWLSVQKYILYVSKFDVYKHQMEVAVAYSKLPEFLKYQYQLVFVGEADNHLAKDVREFISNNNLNLNIRLFGSVNYTDLPGIYHHATVNIFASSCENCPNIMLEAIGAGRPVLSSSVAPMPEFGLDAVAYFSPSDPDELKEVLQRALEDKSYRNRLAASAIKRSEAFDWKATTDETWNQLLRLAASE
jgi:glycosyltransferase involved in cell wall biosynthesis